MRQNARNVYGFVVLAIVAGGVGYYVGRPTLLSVTWDDAFASDALSEGVDDVYMVTRDAYNVSHLVRLNESGNSFRDAFGNTLTGFAFTRSQDGVFEGYNATSESTHEYDESESFTDDFSQLVEHNFSYDWSTRFGGYLNASFSQNFSDYVSQSFSASGEIASTSHVDSESWTLSRTSDGATEAHGFVLSRWLNFVSDSPTMATGNLTKVTTPAGTGASYLRNGSGYLTLSDTSTGGKAHLITQDTTRWAVTNVSRDIRIDIRWRGRYCAGTYAGADFYVTEYDAASGGAVTGGIEVVRTANFDWETASIEFTPNAATTHLTIVVVSARAWQNDAVGMIDVESIKMYEKRHSYAYEDTLTLSLSHDEATNASWERGGCVAVVTATAAGSVANRLDYDHDLTTDAGQSQAGTRNQVNRTTFENVTTIAAESTQILPAGVWNWSGFGEGIASHSLNVSGDDVVVDVEFDALTSDVTVTVDVTVYTYYHEANWSVESTVGTWVNNTASVEWDVGGTGNYTFTDLDVNATARVEITYVLEALVSTLYAEYFSETVENHVGHTFTFVDTVVSTTNLSLSHTVTATDYAYSVVTLTNVTTVVMGGGWENVTTITHTHVITYRREFVVVPVEPVTIGFPSWNRSYRLRLNGLDTSGSTWSVDFDVIEIQEVGLFGA